MLKYGLQWPEGTTSLDIELACIRKGGTWKEVDGKEYGLGLFEHYMNARKLLWPHRHRHKWTELMYRYFIVPNTVTILMGAGSTEKTSHASEFGLIKYFCSPHNTLVLLSTTTVDKLDMAIFGEIKMLFQSAKEIHPELPGICLDSKHCITTDDISEGEIRDMRRGIVGRALYVGKQWVGLGVFAGVKQQNIVFIADELQFCAPTFLDCLPNMFQNPNVTVIGSGNPKHDPYDQLGKAAEPRLGWASLGDIKKTAVWPTKFENSYCINLVGIDSPNFDVPEDQPIPYPRMVNRNTVRRVASFWGENSLEYFKQCMGVMKIGMIGNRVITAELCRQHKAMENAVWNEGERTKIYAVDPAWGGPNADRCVAGWAEFGKSIDGTQIIRLTQPKVIPIVANASVLPDDQIALFVKEDCEQLGIPPSHIYYDSTGRGTVGAAFARVFGASVPVPIAFGDRPSKRPVRHDLFVIDNGERRHKRCDEYYSKFVTELWFSVRYIIECDQMRELPESVMNEGCMREYGEVAGNKLEVESKDDTRERMGCSPDEFDWCAIICEGARQRGFKIQRLGITMTEGRRPNNWLDQKVRKHEKLVRSKQLNYA